jgi:hypothetical protein
MWGAADLARMLGDGPQQAAAAAADARDRVCLSLHSWMDLRWPVGVSCMLSWAWLVLVAECRQPTHPLSRVRCSPDPLECTAVCSHARCSFALFDVRGSQVYKVAKQWEGLPSCDEMAAVMRRQKRVREKRRVQREAAAAGAPVPQPQQALPEPTPAAAAAAPGEGSDDEIEVTADLNIDQVRLQHPRLCLNFARGFCMYSRTKFSPAGSGTASRCCCPSGLLSKPRLGGDRG